MGIRYQNGIYQLSDFIDRTIPKRGPGSDLFVHRVLSLLKTFGVVQEKNALVTMVIQTGGALGLYYRGQILFQLKPALRHLRLIMVYEPKSEQKRQFLDMINRRDSLFDDDTRVSGTGQWRVHQPEIDVLNAFVAALPADTARNAIRDPSHPRNFPPEVRQAALAAFEQGGHFCPGAAGRKRHKLTGERIEFDHIIPHSRRGSNSIGNVQVLCVECNRRKRDRAI